MSNGPYDPNWPQFPYGQPPATPKPESTPLGDLLKFYQPQPPPAILGSLPDFSSYFTKRSIFVSYHHGGDRSFYDSFAQIFADTYSLIQDNSVERQIDSDNSEYVIRRIREEHITGSSCTVVLCGAETPNRKFVDWEIKATLDKEHGLIGVNLPSNPKIPNGNVFVPLRLWDNIQSGYAVWTHWDQLTSTPSTLTSLIEQANAKNKLLIWNQRDLMGRNL